MPTQLQTLFDADDDVGRAGAIARRIGDAGGGEHIAKSQRDERLHRVSCSCGRGNKSWASNRSDAWTGHFAHLTSLCRGLGIAAGRG